MDSTILKVYAAKNRNDDIRMRSASGGMFSVLAEQILKLDGVVYGAAFDNYMVLKHIRVCETEKLNRLRGSKYIQSANMQEIIKQLNEDAKNEKWILYSGTPCQVEAVKRIMGKYEKIVLCDIICHGVVKPVIFKDFVKHIEKNKKSKLKEISFRDKKFGWRNQQWSAVLESGEILSDIELQDYKKIFYSHYGHLDMCLSCKFTNLNRTGDITLGDYWGIENVFPEFIDDKGISLILINSSNGKKLFDDVKDKVQYIESSIDKCMQPQLQYPVNVNEKEKMIFWKLYKKKGFYKACKFMFSRKLSYRMTRNIIGMLQGETNE